MPRSRSGLDRRRSPSGDNRERSRSRGYRSSRRHRSRSTSGTVSRHRPAPLTWKFVSTAGVITHDASCAQCSNWLGHRIASDKGDSWAQARDDEDDDWVDTLRSRGYLAPDEVTRQLERARAEWDEARDRARPPAKRVAPAAAPASSTELLQELRTQHAALQKHLAHVERVAEELRRALARTGDERPNTWSAAAAALTDDELRIKVVSHEVHLAYYATDDDDDEEELPAARRRLNTRPHRGARSLTASSSPSPRILSPAAKGKARAAPPLEERISAWGEPSQAGVQEQPHSMHDDVPITEPGPSLSSRISHPTPLAERMDVQLPKRPAAILPKRVPGHAEWMPPNAQEVLQNYYHENTDDGKPVPLTERQPGKYRVVHGRLIDLSQDFPPSPPTIGHLNPFTGQAWTAQEVLLYPRGIPNWPSEGLSKISEAERIGFPIGTASLMGGKYDARVNGNRPSGERDPHLIRDMDRSRRLLPLRMVETGGAWDMPRSLDEALTLRAVARTACNLMAWEHWLKVVVWANRTPVPKRTEVHQSILSRPMPRPLWAIWVPPKATSARKGRSYQRVDRRSSTQLHRHNSRDTIMPDVHRSTAPTGEEIHEQDTVLMDWEEGEVDDGLLNGPTPDLHM
ncbi:hypothetical protein BDW22DRAFT_1343115 [Trametopsis cervina]|nr:hypothetical protein BDW22DRAFT_1343115 [Trametopsis cervina]